MRPIDIGPLGMTATRFRDRPEPPRAGTAIGHSLRGDELCGLPHTDKTRGLLVVEDAAAFRAWVKNKRLETRQ